MTENHFTLTFSCCDQPGIVFQVTKFLFDQGCNIVDSAQYNDRDTEKFFMRVSFVCSKESMTCDTFPDLFSETANRLALDWNIYDRARPQRVMILASKPMHCLIDLLYRYSIRDLNIEIPMIVSNHRDSYQLAASYDVPFLYLPITKENKASQELKLLDIVETEKIDLIVLARYMQVLTKETCAALPGKIINIHHSFLPSFKGAKPYHQAHHRGVKLIGATAHYVTEDLDEGPIIEQDVARVDHAMSPSQLVSVGRDIEKAVLARAVKAHTEHRVFLNGHKTVVFN